MFEVLDDFLVFIEVERRLSPQTCRAYRRDVRACLEFLQGGALRSAPTRSAPALHSNCNLSHETLDHDRNAGYRVRA